MDNLLRSYLRNNLPIWLSIITYYVPGLQLEDDPMKKLSLKKLLTSSIAFTAVSATTADSLLLFTDSSGIADIPLRWYINAPLLAWGLVGLPLSFAIAERLYYQVSPRPPKITGFLEEMPNPLLRGIALNVNGKKSTLLASAVPSIFGEELPDTGDVYRPAAWRVNDLIIREGELKTFLEAAARRNKYQFSRNYWTRKKRPPIQRDRYNAYIHLLVSSGLLSGRTGGSSGYLITCPRSSITYLKYESPYKTHH